MTRRRQPPSYSSLTSLLDVLFILVFASLVQSATLVERAEDELDEAPADAGPDATPADAGTDAMPADAGSDVLDHDELYERAVGEIALQVRARDPIFVRVDPSGLVTAIESEPGEAPRRLEVDVPLIERVADPDVGLAYLGDVDPALRICAIVARTMNDVDLSSALVVIVPGAPLSRLPVALVEGLRRDQDRCMVDEGVFAVVVDPTRYPQEAVP